MIANITNAETLMANFNFPSCRIKNTTVAEISEPWNYFRNNIQITITMHSRVTFWTFNPVVKPEREIFG